MSIQIKCGHDVRNAKRCGLFCCPWRCIYTSGVPTPWSCYNGAPSALEWIDSGKWPPLFSCHIVKNSSTMNEGWIKIYYKMLDWEWMDDPYVVTLWVRILLNANPKERKWHGLTVKRGQWLTSVHHIAEQTGWSRNTIKRILRILEQSNQITVETSNDGVLITVTNYGKYQCKGGSNADPLNNKCGSINDPQGDPLPDPQPDPYLRKKEYKKVRKEETPYGGDNARPREMGLESYGILHNVMLSAQQHRTLSETFGQSETDTAIDELSCKLADGTFDSRNHYATLHYWLSYRINSGTVKPSTPQQDPYFAEKQVWAAFSEKDKQEYLQAHGGKHPWEE